MLSQRKNVNEIEVNDETVRLLYFDDWLISKLTPNHHKDLSEFLEGLFLCSGEFKI